MFVQGKEKTTKHQTTLRSLRIYNNKVCLHTAHGEPGFCRKMKLSGYK